MIRRVFCFVGFNLLIFLAACGPGSLATPRPSPAATPRSAAIMALMLTPAKPAAACADVDANWGHNWPGALEALDDLIAAGQSCGEEPLLSKKYAAHFNYAAALEGEGRLEQAVAQYQAALALDPHRREALDALLRLEALPRPTPPACLSDSPSRPDPAPTNVPDLTGFVKVENGQLRLKDQPFTVRGVNYYPRQAPWERFYQEADPAQMAAELDAIKAAGFNTLRIFLWYRPLFTCQPEDAIPDERTFALVDRLFDLAGQRDLKLIVTLNDLPDLVFRPLYLDWDHYDWQTIYIIRRYRNEPALLAWDVRNGGNQDYGRADSRFSKTEVIDWLEHITGLIRAQDPHHLITAGWAENSTITEPYVDLISFQYWDEADQFQTTLATYQGQTEKPLLLLATGYHSWAESPDDPQGTATQAKNLAEVTQTAEAQGLAGWLIWSAFDFVPAPGQTANQEFYFGLWRTDLSPKPVLEALPLPQRGEFFEQP